jgi:predicted nucleic acid-binding protein
MFVVDASMALSWCIDDEATDETDGILHRLLLEGGIAPAHWPLELGNAIRSAARRGRVKGRDVERARSIIEGLPVEVVPVETPTALRLIDVAMTFDLSVYDAAYLDLADLRGLGVATLDARLAEACRQAGVSLIAA